MLQPVSALDHGNWKLATCCRIDNFARHGQPATVVAAAEVAVAAVAVAAVVAVVNCQCYFFLRFVLPKPGLCKLQCISMAQLEFKFQVGV